MRLKVIQNPGIEQLEEIQKRLKAFGLKTEKVNKLLEKHDEQYLWANIGIVEKQIKRGKIKNPAGYLLKALEKGYQQQQTEYDLVQQKAIAEKKAQLALHEEEQKEQADLDAAFEEWRG